MNTKISAKDFFLHLGAIAAFYASTIALITLLFEVINFAYPKITNAYQYWYPSISFQVATLIVAFPLFLFLSWLMQRSYYAEPALKENWLRRLLSYLTLFIAGGVVAGDLITLIYMFLDGQELTTGFVLKVLALGIVAAGIFLYYLREIRNSISSGERNMWRIIAGIVIVGSIVLGFAVIGSPAAQRSRRYDAQRISDLQSIQWQVVSYFQRKGSIPSALDELNDPLSGFIMPKDPKTNQAYEYKLIGQSAKAFELCATFDREGSGISGMMPRPMMTSGIAEGVAIGMTNENWAHKAGRHCFSRSIDRELYPPVKSLR